jgi:hypothetical protein
METVRKEESLLASLSELRAIEHQRLADERAAALADMQARRDRQEAAARTAREAEGARLAAERAARLAAEQAHAAAEQQARLQIEAVEVAERARHQAALDERRLHEELALRREVALRQRPRWMVAVTAIAVIAAVGLGGFAVERQRASTVARAARERAREDQARAERAVLEAQAALDQLIHDLADLDRKVGAAMQRVIIAQSDADRRAAQDGLRQLQRRQAELAAQQHQREEDRKHRERTMGVVIAPDCLNNAICK